MKEEIKPGHEREKNYQDKSGNTNTQNPGKNQKIDETKDDRDMEKDDKNVRR